MPKIKNQNKLMRCPAQLSHYSEGIRVLLSEGSESIHTRSEANKDYLVGMRCFFPKVKQLKL